MIRTLAISLFILLALIITMLIKLHQAYSELDVVRNDREYLLMQQDEAIRQLKDIQFRIQAEDSLRAVKSKQNEENIRIIRAASASTLQQLIERAAADTTRLRLLH